MKKVRAVKDAPKSPSRRLPFKEVVATPVHAPLPPIDTTAVSRNGNNQRPRQWWQSVPDEEFKQRIADFDLDTVLTLWGDVGAALAITETQLQAGHGDPIWRSKAMQASGYLSAKKQFLDVELKRRDAKKVNVQHALLVEAGDMVEDGDLEGAVRKILGYLGAHVAGRDDDDQDD
jgi:hypothetical protein